MKKVHNILWMPHISGLPEYHGMSGKPASKNLEVFFMCNNGCGFFGGNMCWIIILLILFCGCGNGMSSYSCGNDSGCGGCC